MSIFRQALGDAFGELHPAMQRRFALVPGQRSIGRGVMSRIWRGPAYMTPFLALGAGRHLLFPESGTEIPFTIENCGYGDAFGREAVSFVRTFEVAPGLRRRFDAAMVLDPERGIVDFLGTHHHVAAALELEVRDGGLELSSTAQSIALGRWWPLPAWATGHARVRESYDESSGQYVIAVRVDHPLCGPIFGYEGRFTAEFDTGPPPTSLLPTRERSLPPAREASWP
ncbi:DUF4166 domain-containing protein [Aeromicrobium sp. YIM 150415]|uniref:DUF4166 domain-containing protein n=1 Tax=Aeromicrobium sp. YIM 150415 TaxID=2803912 RepID=UPI00196672CB|nr:DUF4166 domain-containing protein [Aeromicrobium sp. YIM 150415]MBM9463084.1 DUF4166 domain-containing protein [Aeromicrobium sp. YIM 150415]